MNPQIPTPQTQPSRKQRVYLLAGLAMLIVLMVVFWQSRTSFEHRELTITNLRYVDNFGYVSDSELFFYNGLAFYKVDLTTGSSTALVSGLKLPNPSFVNWAKSSGALLNFNSSFYASEIDRISRDKSGERLEREDRDNTWYLDFDTKELYLVDEAPLAQDLAYYSPSTRGFYYITSSGGSVSLKFFDLSSRQSRKVGDTLKLTDITYLGGCTNYQVCLIARDPGDQSALRLYGINESQQLVEIYNSQGRLFATGSIDGFVSIPNGSGIESPRSEAFEEEIEFGDQPAFLYELGNNQTSELSFKVGESDLLMGFGTGAEFFALGNSTETNISPDAKGYIAGRVGGQTSLVNLVYSSGEKFDGNFMSEASFADGGIALLTTVQGDQLVFSTRDLVGKFSTISEEEASSNAQSCSNSNGSSVDYFSTNREFRVYITFDSTFYDKISSFSTCLVETNTLGYYYTFVGIDSASGKIVTD